MGQGRKQCEPGAVLVGHGIALGIQAVSAWKMDEFGKEIFELWMSGRAPADVTFDNPKWTEYMRAAKGLDDQVERQLSAYAELMRPEVDQSQGRVWRMFRQTFHAEVGGNYGGYYTGYQLLHGTNKAAGDFEVNGHLTASRLGGPGSSYDLIFNDLAYTFHDRVDVNKRYSADLTFGRVASNVNRCTGQLPPKDFNLHIKWKAGYEISVKIASAGDMRGKAPGWLKQFNGGGH